ncbi:MAG: preprotein translocase subunit SecY [Elusimicrobiaceae bacterium]|nr:preprotein translocase subunit SecY [Elusimicrobiaceae bacterium]
MNLFRIPELKKRMLFVLIALAVYRAGAAIPIPGINSEALRSLFDANRNNLLGFLDIFSGGALGKFSILSMGVMPYINASIIMSLLSGAHVIPYLDRLSKEGELGRRKVNQITRVFTLVLAAFQSFGLTMALSHMPTPGNVPIVIDPSPLFFFTTVLTLTTGTLFVMWLGEQMTENGIGNGISLIIFAGIVDRIPSGILNLVRLVQADEIGIVFALVMAVAIFGIMGFVIWVETAQRKIPVQYAKRQVGRKMVGGASSYLPLKVDQSGVIAVIFAISLLMLPMTIMQFNPTAAWAQSLMDYFNSGGFLYEAAYAALIVFFCYFYNSVSINPKELADNMKKWGGFIPGIRAGDPTASHIEWILNRITFGGALFVVLIAIVPDVLRQKYALPFSFGGTTLLIVVGVALDTIGQLEAHLLMRNYEPMMKGQRIRGRWFNVGSQ